MFGLSGKKVLITGGTTGIGLAAARRFLEEGCRVFVGGLRHDDGGADPADPRFPPARHPLIIRNRRGR